ncbi:MAG: hypothetical protein ACRCZF_07580, partial [Gemmataceae bacterium]
MVFGTEIRHFKTTRQSVCLLATLGVFLLSAMPVLGQVTIFNNPITGTNPNLANPYATGQVLNANLTSVGIARGNGINGNNAGDRYNANSWNTPSIDLDAHFAITFSPAAGFSVEVSRISGTSQTSGTGPSAFAMRSSVDSFGANVGATLSATAFGFNPIDMTNLNGLSGFRLYAWNATSAAGTYSVNDFSITGLVSNRWSGSTSGSLSDLTNWQGAGGPTSLNGIQFEGASNTAVTVDAATTVQGIRFANGASAFTISGPSTLTLGSAGNVFNYSANTQTMNANVALAANQILDARTGDLVFGGVISGSNNLTVRGTSTTSVIMNGINTYTGTTTVSSGTLGGTGTIVGATTVNSGGTIRGDSGAGT